MKIKFMSLNKLWKPADFDKQVVYETKNLIIL